MDSNHNLPPGHDRRSENGPSRRPWSREGSEEERGRERRERRSGVDRRRDAANRPGYVERRRGWIARGREFISRHREPLIGLGVAAATAPLAFQGKQQVRRQRVQPEPAEGVATAREPTRDLEERIARRWAAEQEASVREDTIQGAITRYSISRGLAADIYDIAVEEGIEPDIAYGLVNTESSFRQRAVSSVGARGLTQLMPATAQWLVPGLDLDNLFDRELNLHIGFGYLDRLIGKYNGNLRLALLAYNRGPGTVDRILDRGGDPSNGYAERVLSG